MTLMPQVPVGHQLTSATATSPVDLHLQIGPSWTSFEQLRLGGGGGLVESISPGTVGRLITKEAEFAILLWRDFDRLYGLARDVQRLAQGVVLLRQAAEVVLKSADKELGIQMIRDMSLHYQLPQVGQAALPPVEGELDQEQVDADRELDLDTFVAPRPNWR